MWVFAAQADAVRKAVDLSAVSKDDRERYGRNLFSQTPAGWLASDGLREVRIQRVASPRRGGSLTASWRLRKKSERENCYCSWRWLVLKLSY